MKKVILIFIFFFTISVKTTYAMSTEECKEKQDTIEKTFKQGLTGYEGEVFVCKDTIEGDKYGCSAIVNTPENKKYRLWLWYNEKEDKFGIDEDNVERIND